MNPILTADKWLAGGGAYINSNVMGWLYSDENWASVSTLPRFEHLPAHLRDREMLRKTHRRLVYDWREAAYPYCMNHGDCHMGQGYILPSGEVEFLDWQCVMKNSWANDYANFIISGLSIADRRTNEKDLLEFYLGQLKERGVAAPSFETAWHLDRVYAFKCIGMLLCKPSMQSEANCTAIGERNAAAIIDLDAIGAVNSELPVPA